MALRAETLLFLLLSHRFSMRLALASICLLVLVTCVLRPSLAQSYDAQWHDPDRPYVKIGVVEDGIVQVTGSALAAVGVPLSTDPSTFRLIENGREIPLLYFGSPGTLTDEARLVFAGQRNTGADETWAYAYDAGAQSSTHLSLYSDTTFYWLTWGDGPGLRYELVPYSPRTGTQRVYDTARFEEDARFYAGDANDAFDPRYTRGEGFYLSGRIFHPRAGTRSVTLSLTLPQYSAAPGDSVRLRVRVNSVNPVPYDVSLDVEQPSGNRTTFVPVTSAQWTGYQLQTLEATVPTSLLHLSEDDQIRVRLTSVHETADRKTLLVDWLEADYPRALRVDSTQFGFAPLGAQPGTSQRYSVVGLEGTTVLALAPAAGTYTRGRPTDGVFHFEAPVIETRPVYWVAAEDSARAPASIARDASSGWHQASNEADYVIVTTPALRASAEEMAAYRASQNGFRTAVVLVQDVFDEFDYGRPTPIALQRFVHATQRWNVAPRYVLIWADALTLDRTSPLLAWEVPSFGRDTPSDGWFAMQLDGPDDWTDAVPIGRVPVRSNEAGRLFLDKMRTYESQPPAMWQKNLILISGGINASERSYIASNINRWGGFARQSPVGVDTTLIRRSDTDTFIDYSQPGVVTDALERGAGWLTYFGHSATYFWELNVDDPDQVDNQDELAVILSLGCATGNFTDQLGDAPSLSEEFLLGGLGGAIAHVGFSGFSTASASVAFGDQLHQLVFGDTLRVLGDAVTQAKDAYGERTSASTTALLLFGLVGDPATQLALPSRPDFRLSPSGVAVSPETPSPADPQLDVLVRADNVGLVPSDSMTVQVERTWPDGATDVLRQRIAPFARTAEATFSLPLAERSVGENVVAVTLDALDQIDELSETNNRVEVTKDVVAGSILVLTPEPFATVASAPTFRVLVPPSPSPVTSLHVQLDTRTTFDSPALVEARVPVDDAYVEWTPPLAAQPGGVYHWRVRPDRGGEAARWETASFSVAETAPGHVRWTQRGTLFEAGTQSGLTYADGRWTLDTETASVRITASVGGGATAGAMYLDDIEHEFAALGYGLLIVSSERPEVRAHGTIHPYIEGGPEAVRDSLQRILDHAHPGDYIFARNFSGTNWRDRPVDAPVQELFRALGSTAVDTLTLGDTWILAARSGMPDAAQEWVGPSFGQQPFIEFTRRIDLPYQRSTGTVVSPQIGPVAAWQSLQWEAVRSTDASTVTVDVLNARTGEVLIGDLRETSTPVDLSGVDPAAVPFLQLRATLSDTSLVSTPQLQAWSVDYAPQPEILFVKDSFAVSADSLRQGAGLTASAQLANLSALPVEAVAVRLRLQDAAGDDVSVQADTVRAVGPGATADVQHELGTETLTGAYTLVLDAEVLGVPERFAFNNTARTRFVVTEDDVAPALTVLIDGQAVPADPEPVRDLQSPDLPLLPLRPVIEVSFEDDNTFKLLQDTSLATITLENVTAGTTRRVPFSSPDIVFEPATDEENRARIVFTPDFTGQDAVYTLRVRAFDVDGNEAEGSPYQAHFRVQSAFSISSLLPYPNPMHTFTRFAFELRGADLGIIDDFRIRVFTLTGRLVREFDLLRDPSGLDSGGLRVGWNKLAWDGRDDDGDLLAPGVYLYKVNLRVEGEEQAINNDASLEKLVIVR